ncbi:uncharacterized protein LOC112056785 [Bicyclus anynana]|uniref:Uncharacterized protein LOC112056785 n=1 Tax=Bicyclus anynana TaxID=110368 RepID=A0A6J1P5G3_BICAN|nr:uncharacterized protein LOC112056785 [Bicyclus anynana]
MISDFAKEKVFWTQRMNLRLVKFIEKRPNIWNPKHPKYTSVAHRDKIYNEFAARYGNDFTGQAVKERWTNIRSTFANHLRKIKTSEANGQEYQVSWHLWNACQFLRKVRRGQKTCKENDNDETVPNDGEEYQSGEETSNNILSNSGDSMCKSIAENLFTIFNGVKNGGLELENTKYGKVGRLVTKKLNQMNSFEAAKTSQKILDILLLYDRENPLNPNNYKTESV